MLQNPSVKYAELISNYNKVFLSAAHVFSGLKEITGLHITDISLKAWFLFQWWANLIHFWSK